MRAFLCLSCGEVYDEFVENSNNVIGNSCGSLIYTCPKMNCDGSVIEIDDFLVSTIRNLNNFGFQTMACCSGHSQDSTVQLGNDVYTYILFYRELMGFDIPSEILSLIEGTLPNGFELTENSYEGVNRFLIEKKCNCKSEMDCMRNIGNNCAELLEWTEIELPKIMNKLFPNGLDDYPIWVEDDRDFIGEMSSEDTDLPI